MDFQILGDVERCLSYSFQRTARVLSASQLGKFKCLLAPLDWGDWHTGCNHPKGVLIYVFPYHYRLWPLVVVSQIRTCVPPHHPRLRPLVVVSQNESLVVPLLCRVAVMATVS